MPNGIHYDFMLVPCREPHHISILSSVWERVVNQVDLNATASKGKTTADKADKSAGAAASSAAVPTIPAVDKSRFKSMLMQLKNDAKAPGNQPVTAQ